MTSPKVLKVFISYSHKDEKLCSLLRDHLASLLKEGIIEEWYDRKIIAGQKWDELIKDNLLASNIILFLVSSSFLSSGYITSTEMELALMQYEKGAAQVIPVILKPVYWQSTVLGQLQALPIDARPVTTWKNRDQAFVNIVKGIRNVAEEIQKAYHLTDESAKQDMRAPSECNSRNEQATLWAGARTRASRAASGKSLIAVDIDDFTVINRKYGPSVGDAIKLAVSLITSDYLSRLCIQSVHDWIQPFSDEYYILVALSEEDALSVADNLRQRIWKYEWNTIVQGLCISVTCGVSLYRSGDAPEDVVIRALLGIKAGKLKRKNAVYRGPLFRRDNYSRALDRGELMEIVNEMCSGDRRTTCYKGYMDDEEVILNVEREQRLYASNALSVIACFFGYTVA